MLYVAHIADGLVVRVTLQAANYACGPDEVAIGPGNVVGIGWGWDGTQFVPPVVAEVVE
jgi:hypothetical protein